MKSLWFLLTGMFLFIITMVVLESRQRTQRHLPLTWTATGDSIYTHILHIEQMLEDRK